MWQKAKKTTHLSRLPATNVCFHLRCFERGTYLRILPELHSQSGGEKKVFLATFYISLPLNYKKKPHTRLYNKTPFPAQVQMNKEKHAGQMISAFTSSVYHAVLRFIAFFVYVIDVIIFHWLLLSNLIAWLNVILPLLCRAWACWRGQSPSCHRLHCEVLTEQFSALREKNTTSTISPLYDRHDHDTVYYIRTP